MLSPNRAGFCMAKANQARPSTRLNNHTTHLQHGENLQNAAKQPNVLWWIPNRATDYQLHPKFPQCRPLVSTERAVH